MDEFEDSPDQGVEAAPQPEVARDNLPEWASKELADLRGQNKELRSERTRLRIGKQYGDEVVELIPVSLPLREQEELAAKLADRLPKAPEPTDQAETVEEPTEAEPTEAERKLATVAGNTAPGSPPAGALTARELYQQYQQDPAAATRDAIEKYRAKLSQ